MIAPRALGLCVLFILAAMALPGCASMTNKAPDDEASVLFCGDVMLDWGVKELFLSEGYDYPLKRIRQFFSGFDARFCNLECPISDKGDPHPEKKYIFIAPPGAARILAYGGISGVSLANNHAMDFGAAALADTIAVLEKNGIAAAGAGADVEKARIPMQLELKGTKLAVLCYTNTGNKEAYATKTAPGIAKAGIEIIRRDVQALRKTGAVIVVSLHWGDEYADYPSAEQVDLAHDIIDAGADAIIGHHSHIYQGVELYKGKPVFYSLGNFLFGSINEEIRDNIVVALRLKKGVPVSLEIYPVNGSQDRTHRFQPRRMNGSHAQALLSHLVEISKPLDSEFPKRALLHDSMIRCDLRANIPPASEK